MDKSDKTTPDQETGKPIIDPKQSCTEEIAKVVPSSPETKSEEELSETDKANNFLFKKALDSISDILNFIENRMNLLDTSLIPNAHWYLAEHYMLALLLGRDIKDRNLRNYFKKIKPKLPDQKKLLDLIKNPNYIYTETRYTINDNKLTRSSIYLYQKNKCFYYEIESYPGATFEYHYDGYKDQGFQNIFLGILDQFVNQEHSKKGIIEMLLTEIGQYGNKNRKLKETSISQEPQKKGEEQDVQKQNLSYDFPPPTTKTLFNDSNGKGAIVAGRANLLYSFRNVGKSYFAIEVAKSQDIKNPLYIMIDNNSDEETYRIKHPKLKNKITLIDCDAWEKRCTDIRNEIENESYSQAFFEAYQRFLGFGFIQDIERRKKQIYESLVKDNNKTKIINFMVLEQIFNEAKNDNRDFIILDSLQALSSRFLNTLNFKTIQKLIEIPVKNKITLLLLHHENEEGTAKGSKAVLDVFSYVYRLYEVDKYAGTLNLDTEKAKSTEKYTFQLRRKFIDNCYAEHEIIETIALNGSKQNVNKKMSIEEYLRKIIQKHGQGDLLWEDLLSELRELTENANDEANIEKRLKIIAEKDKIINMKDGKTWKNGIVII